MERIRKLELLEQSLLGLRVQMGVVFATMDKVGVERINEDIKNSSKEDIEKMKVINKLFDEVNYFWSNTKM